MIFSDFLSRQKHDGSKATHMKLYPFHLTYEMHYILGITIQEEEKKENI